jgi:oligosaccharide translocation protein RFT1
MSLTGSLVARIIFQPFEEMARVYFSKTLSICTADEDKVAVDQERNRTRDQPLDLDTKEEPRSIPLSIAQRAALSQASATLHALLLLESHLLLLLLTFLPPYLPVLLSHFLPKKYLATSAPSILQAYAYYLPTMSLNGLLEAFAFSVMSPLDVKSQTRWLFVTSLSFAIVVWLFCERLGLGEVGLVFANVASLGMRAAWAALFSDRWFKRMWSRSTIDSNAQGEKVTSSPNDTPHPPRSESPTGISLGQILPPYSVMVLFTIVSQVVRYSQRFFNLTEDNLLELQHDRAILKAQLQHIIIGGLCGLLCLAECYRSQRTHLKTLLSLVRSRSSK